MTKRKGFLLFILMLALCVIAQLLKNAPNTSKQAEKVEQNLKNQSASYEMPKVVPIAWIISP